MGNHGPFSFGGTKGLWISGSPSVGLSWPKMDDMLSVLTGVVGVNSAGIQAVFDLDQLTPVVREYHSARANEHHDAIRGQRSAHRDTRRTA
jgi:hypothetical protein